MYWSAIWQSLNGKFNRYRPQKEVEEMGAVDSRTVQKVVSGKVYAATAVADCGDLKSRPGEGFGMKLREIGHRGTLPIGTACHYRYESVVLLLLILQPALAQQPGTPLIVKRASLTAPEIVRNLVQMNLRRVHALHTYQGTRIYRVEYRGFPGARSAEMVVNVKYHSPGTKEFIIQSATGSKLIIDRVLRKLLEAETEAQDPEIQRRTALSNDNYSFTLIGSESGPSGMTYLLKVEPRRMDKFLYRGRIWVDAEDFAVVKLEAEPARNPSFWTKKTEIEQVYMKVSDFWLPAHNSSATDIRLGGHAELTITYQAYEITSASQVHGLEFVPVLEHAGLN